MRRESDEAQAIIGQRIFEEFASGISVMEIVAMLADRPEIGRVTWKRSKPRK